MDVSRWLTTGPTKTMDSLPNQIRALREARGWSQDDLARKVRCSKNQISDLERGNRGLTLTWMQRVATALQVTPGALLNRADNPLSLSIDEQRLIALYRQAGEIEREAFQRVSEAMLSAAPDTSGNGQRKVRGSAT